VPKSSLLGAASALALVAVMSTAPTRSAYADCEVLGGGILTVGDDDNVITDWDCNGDADQIALDMASVTSMDDLTFRQVDGDTMITAADVNILVQNTQVSTFTADDFLFLAQFIPPNLAGGLRRQPIFCDAAGTPDMSGSASNLSLKPLNYPFSSAA